MVKTKKMDLFTIGEEYHLAHCVSADFAMGAGIAVEFQRRFRIREQISGELPESVPMVIKTGRVFNLVTKKMSWMKPTYPSFIESVKMLKRQMDTYGITKIAMPKIGCGIDGLDFGVVKEHILNTFDDPKYDVVICMFDGK